MAYVTPPHEWRFSVARGTKPYGKKYPELRYDTLVWLDSFWLLSTSVRVCKRVEILSRFSYVFLVLSFLICEIRYNSPDIYPFWSSTLSGQFVITFYTTIPTLHRSSPTLNWGIGCYGIYKIRITWSDKIASLHSTLHHALTRCQHPFAVNGYAIWTLREMRGLRNNKLLTADKLCLQNSLIGLNGFDLGGPPAPQTPSLIPAVDGWLSMAWSAILVSSLGRPIRCT